MDETSPVRWGSLNHKSYNGMSLKYDSQIAVALLFRKQGNELLGFDFNAVKENDNEGDIIACNDDEAEAWAIHVRMQDGITPKNWIATLEDKAAAKALCDILNNVTDSFKEINPTAIKTTEDFMHPKIEQSLQSLDNQQPYNFIIERTTAGWMLYITEADTALEFDYNTKEDAQHDVLMAANHYHLELKDISALPSIG